MELGSSPAKLSSGQNPGKSQRLKKEKKRERRSRRSGSSIANMSSEEDRKTNIDDILTSEKGGVQYRTISIDEMIQSEKGRVEYRTTNIDETLDSKTGSLDASKVTTPATETLQMLTKIFDNGSLADQQRISENIGTSLEYSIRHATKDHSSKLERFQKERIFNEMLKVQVMEDETLQELTANDVEEIYEYLLAEHSEGDITEDILIRIPPLVDFGLKLAAGRAASQLKNLGKSTDEIELVAQKAKKGAFLLLMAGNLFRQAAIPILYQTMQKLSTMVEVEWDDDD